MLRNRVDVESDVYRPGAIGHTFCPETIIRLDDMGNLNRVGEARTGTAGYWVP
jgi:hypothetical protein